MTHLDPSIQDVICPYCFKPAVLVDSAVVYGGRSFGLVWLCNPCQAWVGVHKGTNTPKGRLANKELRQWKIRAHAAFDPMWEQKLTVERRADPKYPKKKARGKAYAWLAKQLGIRFEDCHIGMFDVETCQRVVEICNPLTIRGQQNAKYYASKS